MRDGRGGGGITHGQLPETWLFEETSLKNWNVDHFDKLLNFSRKHKTGEMTIKHFLNIAIGFSSTTSGKKGGKEGRKETTIRAQYHRNI